MVFFNIIMLIGLLSFFYFITQKVDLQIKNKYGLDIINRDKRNQWQYDDHIANKKNEKLKITLMVVLGILIVFIIFKK